MKNISDQKGFTPHITNRFGIKPRSGHGSLCAGFTIVEVLISSFVFSIIALVVSGLFIQVLAMERRIFASQKIQENGTFIMELMSREIRISQIVDTDQNPAGDSPNCSLTELTIRRPVGNIENYVTIKYSLANGILQRTAPENLEDPNSPNITTDLSSSDVAFSRLNFCLRGSATNTEQARVAILAAIQNKTGREILTANIETTVTSRDVRLKF